MRHANTQMSLRQFVAACHAGRKHLKRQRSPWAFRLLPLVAACFGLKNLFIVSPLVRTSCTLMLRAVEWHYCCSLSSMLVIHATRHFSLAVILLSIFSITRLDNLFFGVSGEEWVFQFWINFFFLVQVQMLNQLSLLNLSKMLSFVTVFWRELF